MSETNFIPHDPSYTVDEFCKAERISRVRLLRAVEARARPPILFQRTMQAHHPRSQDRMAA